VTVVEHSPVLRELFEMQSARGIDGDVLPLTTTSIPLPYADALFRTVLERRPNVVVEVGMAFGVASLAILSALEEAGGPGRLISIDPYELTQWKGCGIEAVRRAGLDERHELIEDFDYLALPELLRSGLGIGFAYLDGWHTFDYTLLDFWYVDRMLETGGVVGFNDCGWPAVDKAIQFVLSHRRYVEVDVGLAPEGIDRPHPTVEDRYFEKRERWEPRWDFFADF
jgi:predicted O-methyltransferase YrrM